VANTWWQQASKDTLAEPEKTEEPGKRWFKLLSLFLSGKSKISKVKNSSFGEDIAGSVE